MPETTPSYTKGVILVGYGAIPIDSEPVDRAMSSDEGSCLTITDKGILLNA